MTTSDIGSLTPREKEILALIGEGDSLAEIAQKLHRSLKTIESHRLSLGRKLKASNRVELAKIAIAHGLVDIGTEAEPSASPEPMAEQELAIIEQINAVTGRLAGGVFLREFCKVTSTLPGIDVAAICMPDLDQQGEIQLQNRCVVGIAQNGVCGEPIQYDAGGTPGEKIIAEGGFFASDNVADAFPEDAWLRENGARGYIGKQLLGPTGDPVGGVALISCQSFDSSSSWNRVIDFYAPRLANELEQYMHRRQIEQQQHSLSQQADQYRKEIESRKGMSSKLGQLQCRTEMLAGPSYLRAMTDAFCDVYDVRFTGISIFKEEPGEATDMYTVAFSDSAQQVDTLRYVLKHTPCQTAFDEGTCWALSGAAAKYPGAPVLANFEIDSYVIVRLVDETGVPIGVIWALKNTAMEQAQVDGILEAMEYAAPRLAIELQQHAQLEQMSRAHEGAMTQVEVLAAELASLKTKLA